MRLDQTPVLSPFFAPLAPSHSHPLLQVSLSTDPRAGSCGARPGIWIRGKMVKKLLEAAGQFRETSGPGHAVACCAGTRISVTMSTRIWLLLGISLLIRKNEGGFGNPHEARALLQKLTGTPCECRGGSWNGETTPLLNVDCGDKIAYLVMRQNVHGAQAWVCSKKAKIIPIFNNKPGPCPCIECHPSVHNTYYEQVQLCTGTDNNTYFTAILTRHFSGTFGGKWDTVPQVQGTSNK
ncbi:uncharacterized protein LOC128566669 [Nycticebus coucang]|uniref:uncharacterized protein LOC128566669 n=1 Tax=Nycticebus coucang TaxID=9470 RepID=UPI00234E0934|nr:uncharacterized protein LOC128566669 [Nycticebus coucang]